MVLVIGGLLIIHIDIGQLLQLDFLERFSVLSALLLITSRALFLSLLFIHCSRMTSSGGYHLELYCGIHTVTISGSSMIDILKFLLDFGIFVLIWIVQLVIYPSFKFYALEDLREWHPIYTRRITIVVMPLMLGQLALSIYILTLDINLYTVGSLLLIVLAWLITFLKAVPLHNALGTAENWKAYLQQLLFWNRWRTIIWSVVFIWTLIYLTF